MFALGFIRDLLRRRRELRGLARLVHTEMEFNRLTLMEIYEYPQLGMSKLTATIEMRTWESVRVRIAEMMPTDDLGSITYYYLFVQELRRVQTVTDLYPDPKTLATNILTILREQETDAIQVTLQYANMQGLLGLYRTRRRLSKYRKKKKES